MIEKDTEWILPENLKKQQKKSRELIDEGKGNTNHGGDFGSYYAYRKGINFDYIKHHVLSNDLRGFKYVKNLQAFLNRKGFSFKGEILYVGCAIGTITNAINQLSEGGITYGIDISNDGIAVAKQKYPNCIFYCQSANDLSNFNNGQFDIIHCKEFYPFTRTNDKEYHMKYLKLFYEKLKRHGFVVLEMVSLNKGFCNTYYELKGPLKKVGFLFVSKDIFLPHKIFSVFGAFSYKSPIYKFTKLITRIIAAFYKVFHISGRISYCYILAKK